MKTKSKTKQQQTFKWAEKNKYPFFEYQNNCYALNYDNDSNTGTLHQINSNKIYMIDFNKNEIRQKDNKLVNLGKNDNMFFFKSLLLAIDNDWGGLMGEGDVYERVFGYGNPNEVATVEEWLNIIENTTWYCLHNPTFKSCFENNKHDFEKTELLYKYMIKELFGFILLGCSDSWSSDDLMMKYFWNKYKYTRVKTLNNEPQFVYIDKISKFKIKDKASIVKYHIENNIDLRYNGFSGLFEECDMEIIESTTIKKNNVTYSRHKTKNRTIKLYLYVVVVENIHNEKNKYIIEAASKYNIIEKCKHLFDKTINTIKLKDIVLISDLPINEKTNHYKKININKNNFNF